MYALLTHPAFQQTIEEAATWSRLNNPNRYTRSLRNAIACEKWSTTPSRVLMTLKHSQYWLNDHTSLSNLPNMQEKKYILLSIRLDPDHRSLACRKNRLNPQKKPSAQIKARKIRQKIRKRQENSGPERKTLSEEGIPCRPDPSKDHANRIVAKTKPGCRKKHQPVNCPISPRIETLRPGNCQSAKNN